MMPIYNFCHLPWNLQDVIIRIRANDSVYGFELELLASFMSY